MDAGRTTLKIHAIQTGTVKVKDCQRVGRGSGFMRQVNILRDRVWTEALPIYPAMPGRSRRPKASLWWTRVRRHKLENRVTYPGGTRTFGWQSSSTFHPNKKSGRNC